MSKGESTEIVQESYKYISWRWTTSMGSREILLVELFGRIHVRCSRYGAYGHMHSRREQRDTYAKADASCLLCCSNQIRICRQLIWPSMMPSLLLFRPSSGPCPTICDNITLTSAAVLHSACQHTRTNTHAQTHTHKHSCTNTPVYRA